jgi:cold-inducible RNA-binding protein
MKIYVGNLPFSSSEDDVRREFEAFGQVTSVEIIHDKVTGRSRGFAFVEMSNSEEAQKAISGLNGKEFNGRALTVNEARPRQEGREGGRRGGFGDRRSGGGERHGGGGERRGGKPSRRDDW